MTDVGQIMLIAYVAGIIPAALIESKYIQKRGWSNGCCGDGFEIFMAAIGWPFALFISSVIGFFCLLGKLGERR